MYHFHAWARKGIGAHITTPDDLGAGTAPAEARTRVSITVHTDGPPVDKAFQIAGPGDIIGIHPEMIVRTDPRPNASDFEPNYLAAIEFYDEDFPWRYAPAAPVGPNQSRLRPWLFLLVLTENEFVKTDRRVPLDSIRVTAPEALPPHTELHLWAHVHSNLGANTTGTPIDQILAGQLKASETDPDGLYSRLLCPRKLQPDTLYQAFLVPAFEAGRLAGLGLPVADISAQQPAWTDQTQEIELPTYYRWQFRTGANADFETLMRLIEPLPLSEMDPRIGVRDIDCSRPGYQKLGTTEEMPALEPPVLGLGGAVKSLNATPTPLSKPPEQQPFVKELKKLLALQVPEEDPEKDPIISVPFYGWHHAKTVSNPNPKLEPANNGWPNELNRDPRNRIAAGLGTQALQTHQEPLMQRAWAQLSLIPDLNKLVRKTRFALEVNRQLFTGVFQKMDAASPEKTLAITQPVATRLKADASTTIARKIQTAKVPEATFSSAFRRLLRPGGAVAQRMKTTAQPVPYKAVFNSLNPNFIFFVFVRDPFDSFSTSNLLNINQLPSRLPRITALQSNLSTTPTRAFIVNTQFIRPAATELSVGLEIAPDPVNPAPWLDAGAIKGSVLGAINPAVTFMNAYKAIVKTPGQSAPTDILPVMAHPDFPEPTYQYLAEISRDYIVPNLDLIPANKVVLMEPNFRFIHSFLVGLNHEMGREMLWREFPTDQRGTYFRQFWDPGGRRAPEGPDQSIYPYKDIRPITDWGPTADLNDHRLGRTFPTKPLVLLLRADLLKKYPSVIIYAQKAVRSGNKLVLVSDPNNINALKYPLFTGELPPDIRLGGFNLTPGMALGTETTQGFSDHEGWFFVFAEAPGDPRFGMDTEYSPPQGNKNGWDNLSWDNLPEDEVFVSSQVPPSPSSNGLGWPSDTASESWGRSSTDMAGILLQKPVMLAIHAKELLKGIV